MCQYSERYGPAVARMDPQQLRFWKISGIELDGGDLQTLLDQEESLFANEKDPVTRNGKLFLQENFFIYV